MFKVYYYYNYDKHEVTVYSIRKEDYGTDYVTMFLIYFYGHWQWVNAAACDPCEEEEN